MEGIELLLESNEAVLESLGALTKLCQLVLLELLVSRGFKLQVYELFLQLRQLVFLLNALLLLGSLVRRERVTSLLLHLLKLVAVIGNVSDLLAQLFDLFHEDCVWLG